MTSRDRSFLVASLLAAAAVFASFSTANAGRPLEVDDAFTVGRAVSGPAFNSI